jgi:hypothetical protein
MPTIARRRHLSSDIRASSNAATGAVLASAAVVFAMLLAARPHFSGGIAAWRGDELAIGSTWLVAIVCAAWLALTTLACLAAVAGGQHGVAADIARFAPPFTRRILPAALVSALAFAPTAAHAEAGSSSDVPVVRAPPTSTTSPSRPNIASAPAPTSAPSPSPRPVAPSAPVPVPVPPAAARTYVVRAGDNLWLIAKAEVVRRGGGAATEGRVAQYWQHVVAANRTTLRSGDPSLIFPGEVVALPLD